MFSLIRACEAPAVAADYPGEVRSSLDFGAGTGRERPDGFEENVGEKRTFAGRAGKGGRTLCSYKLAITCWVHSLEIAECPRLAQGNILANARLTKCDITNWCTK